MSESRIEPKRINAAGGVGAALRKVAAGISPLEGVLVVVAVAFTLLYLYVGLTRVFYPYSLDFIEDNIVMQAWRVAQNQPVFVAPNAEFVPQVYMPLYTWIGGLIFKVTGPGFGPLRFFSFAATLATAALIYWIARRESGSWIVALAGAGLFLAGYRLVGGWYELARVENLFVLLSLVGVAAAVYYHHTPWGLMAAGILLGLSLLTKQNGMLFIGGTAVYLLINARWRIWLYALAVLGVGVLPLWVANVASDGWFATYTFGIAYASPIDVSRVGETLRREIFGAMLVLTLSLLLTLATHLWRRGLKDFVIDSVTGRAWPVFIGAAVFVTIAGRATIGGARQNYIMGYAFLCLAPALLAAELAYWRTERGRWARPLLTAALLLQFPLAWSASIHDALGIFNSSRFVPTADMRAAGDELVARISAVDGPVFVMMHPPYALMAGKEPSVHIQSLYHARWRASEPLPADLVNRLENQYYAAIISDESEFFEDEPALLALLEENYVRVELPPTQSPSTLSGPLSRPSVVYMPK